MSALIEGLECRRLLAVGDPDFAFGGDGFVDVETPPGDSGNINSISVDSYGGVIVLASSLSYVTRYNADGSVDQSFKSRAFSDDSIPSKSNPQIHWESVDSYRCLTSPGCAVRVDGKVLLAGSVTQRNSRPLVARLDRDGERDRTFSGDGYASIRMEEGWSGRFRDVTLAGNQRILAVGSVAKGNDVRLLVARFNPDGRPDKSFSKDGYLVDRFAGGRDLALHVVQHEGGILVGGLRTDGSGKSRGLVVRYRVNGKLDRSFSGDGWFGLSGHGVSAIAGQSDGKFLVATNPEGASRGSVHRFNLDGSRDKSFANNGVLRNVFKTPDGDGFVADVVVQDKGKIIIAGNVSAEESDDNGVIARYLPDGTIDSTFGSGGVTSEGMRGRNMNVDDIELDPWWGLVAITADHNLDPVLSRIVLSKPDGVSFNEIYGLDRSTIRVPVDTYLEPVQRYRVERSIGEDGPWTLAKVLELGMTIFDDEVPEPGRYTYYYRVRAENVAGHSRWYRSNAAHIAIFDDIDIGNPLPEGGAGNPHNSSGWTLGAGGADIFGTSDQFQFAYQPLAGDFHFEFRDIRMGPRFDETFVHEWAKVGLMARESLAADSRYVGIFQSFANGPRFQVRSTPGGSTTASGTGPKTLPITLRLRRAGDTFIAYRVEGFDDPPIEIGRVTLDLPDTIYFGIAATSHKQGTQLRAGGDIYALVD